MLYNCPVHGPEYRDERFLELDRLCEIENAELKERGVAWGSQQRKVLLAVRAGCRSIPEVCIATGYTRLMVKNALAELRAKGDVSVCVVGRGSRRTAQYRALEICGSSAERG